MNENYIKKLEKDNQELTARLLKTEVSLALSEELIVELGKKHLNSQEINTILQNTIKIQQEHIESLHRRLNELMVAKGFLT